MPKLSGIVYASLLLGGRAFGAETPPPSTASLANAVSRLELETHMVEFNKIAHEYNGSRAIGSDGYEASSLYVQQILVRHGDRLQTYIHNFAEISTEDSEWSLLADGVEVDADIPRHNTNTQQGQTITAPLVDTPVDDQRGSACTEDQWSGVEATGRIVLIRRANSKTCSMAEQARLAKNHGAVAAIFYNRRNLSGIWPGTFKANETNKLLPAIVVQNYTAAHSWKQRLAAGEMVTVTVAVNEVIKSTPSWNIISETKGGHDTDRVVMLGAQLDSDDCGPDSVDNASGSAALLEIVRVLLQHTGSNTKFRFAWWGSGNTKMTGSDAYIQSLGKEKTKRIRVYFNYKMLASKTPTWGVVDEDKAKFGNETGGSFLLDNLRKQGKPGSIVVGGFSNVWPFQLANIPSSGLKGGNWDPRGDCDPKTPDATNYNMDALEVHTKAAIAAVVDYVRAYL